MNAKTYCQLHKRGIINDADKVWEIIANATNEGTIIQAATRMYYEDRMTAGAIAKIFDVSVSCVNNYIWRVNQKLEGVVIDG